MSPENNDSATVDVASVIVLVIFTAFLVGFIAYQVGYGNGNLDGYDRGYMRGYSLGYVPCPDHIEYPESYLWYNIGGNRSMAWKDANCTEDYANETDDLVAKMICYDEAQHVAE